MFNGPILRILDANANRAREALRVVEDYARFGLNDDSLSARLKELRHDLTAAIGGFVAEAILHRDTPGDVGTDNKTEAEGRRSDLAAVVVAAGKRLGEALRVIEEILKTIDPAKAAAVERIRYRFYDLEQIVAYTLRPVGRFAAVGLYVLITESYCSGPWLETAEQAILGGADCLQLREKNIDSAELLRRARQLVQLCRKHNVLSIINDRVDVAVLADANGVHVGQEDLPVVDVRKLVGLNKIVGVSTHRIDQAHQAVADGADYIGVGPMFRSSTKTRDILPGPVYAREVAESIGIPAVAIAGITVENVDEVLAAGVSRIAVTQAVIAAKDVREAARRLKTKIIEWRKSASELATVGRTFLSANEKAALPMQPTLTKRHGRHLPHWTLQGSTYFVTFRVAEGELNPAERSVVLSHIRDGHGKFYTLVAAVVMPDHVHVLLQPNDGVDLIRITRGIKGTSARRINSSRGVSGSIWQEESWDRIIRDQDELDQKLNYMLHNPSRRGLIEDPWQYEWWFVDQEGER